MMQAPSPWCLKEPEQLVLSTPRPLAAGRRTTSSSTSNGAASAPAPSACCNRAHAAVPRHGLSAGARLRIGRRRDREAGARALALGERVFVPGAKLLRRRARAVRRCSRPRRCAGRRASCRSTSELGERGVLLALAATAYHAICAPGARAARSHRRPWRARSAARAARHRRPAANRRSCGSAIPTRVSGADRTTRSSIRPTIRAANYRVIYDVSGDAALLDTLIARLAPGGEVVLAGFYSEPLSFAFPPAFMREARMRVAARVAPRRPRGRQGACRRSGRLSLDGLITHRQRAAQRRSAYGTAVRRSAPASRWSSTGERAHERMRQHGFSAAAIRRSTFARRGGDRARSGSDRRGEERNADHRDLRQGRHRQELHARQPLLHDGAAGQARAADRLRPEERHHLAPVRRPRLSRPSSRPPSKKKLAGEQSRSATSASSATACSRWSSAGPKSAAAAAGAASSTASSCSRSSASTTGASTTCCSTSWATWCAAASACRSRATCARRSSSSARNDLQSLYVANNVCSAVEYFRKLGGNVGVAGMVINKDDGTGEAQAFAAACRHPGARRDPCRRGHPPQERELRDHRPPRRPLGAAVRGARAERRRGAAGAPEAADAGRAARPVQGRRGRPRRRAGAGDARRHVRRAP